MEAIVYIYSVTWRRKTNYLQENIFWGLLKDDYVRMVWSQSNNKLDQYSKFFNT